MTLSLLEHAIPPSAYPYIGGGLLVLWTVREFLAFLKAKGASGVSADQIAGIFRRLDVLIEKVAATQLQVQLLVTMHNHTDEDGVYVWHLRRDLIRTIQALEDTNEEVVELLREHGAQLTTQGVRLEALGRIPPGERPGA